MFAYASLHCKLFPDKQQEYDEVRSINSHTSLIYTSLPRCHQNYLPLWSEKQMLTSGMDPPSITKQKWNKLNKEKN